MNGQVYVIGPLKNLFDRKCMQLLTGPTLVSRRASSKFSLGAAVTILASMVVALLLGLFAVFLPWPILIPMVVAPVGLILAWIRPEIALVILVAASFGVIPEYLLPRLPVGGGTIRVEDVGVLVMIGIVLLRNGGGIRRAMKPIESYYWPIGAFILAAIVSAALAVGLHGVEQKNTFQELRPFVYWLWLPALCLAIRTEVQMRRFLFGIATVAVVTAGLLMFQSFTGYSVMTKGQAIRDLYTAGDHFRGVLRSTSPASFIILAVLMFLLSSFAYAPGSVRGPLLATLFLVLAGGILVGFGRGVWFSALLGVLLLGYFVRTSRYFGVVCFLVISAASGIALLSMVKPDYVSAAYDRVFSVGNELDYGKSFDRRRAENIAAVNAILDSPLLGVGLGKDYMPINSETTSWESGTRYIHNTYIGTLLKLGPFGLIALLWLVAVTITRLWSVTRRCSSALPIHFSALWAALAMMIFTAITQPNLLATPGVLTVCLAIFVSEWFRSRESAINER
ncbi:O-antigen ligase family protein [Rubrivivax albus]|nr:O-antigen ligase family protein [Rubrivivax albus]